MLVSYNPLADFTRSTNPIYKILNNDITQRTGTEYTSRYHCSTIFA